MTSSLQRRLGDIPGVASVVIDLDGLEKGIDLRLEPGADEEEVMERLRGLLAAYGVKKDRPSVVGRQGRTEGSKNHGVDVTIEPLETGARVEVAASSVRSFRIVAATPLSIAQGLADAWCQVIGRVPIEIVDVAVDEDDRLTVVASDGEHESLGVGEVGEGWVDALISAVAGALHEPDRLRRAAS